MCWLKTFCFELLSRVHRNFSIPRGLKNGTNQQIHPLTSMSISSSIFTALPKMKMYCIRLASSQVFLTLSSKLGSLWSSVSISARVLFRDPIVLREFSERRALGAFRTRDRDFSGSSKWCYQLVPFPLK